MPPNLLLVLIAVFGFVLHALSTDGGGTVLARIGITTWAVPKGAIAPTLVVVGLAYAIFQGVQNGLSWQDAATQGVIAALVSLGGVVGSQHLTGRSEQGLPLGIFPPKGLLMMVGAGVLATYLTACAWFQKHEAEFPTPSDIACAAVDIEKGITDPIVIVKDCPHLAEVAESDLEKLINGQLLAKKRRAAMACVQDAGVEAGK